MRQSKFTETQIVSILKEADAGRPVNEIWRKYEISSATYYKWKAKYGGLDASDVKRRRNWNTRTADSNGCTPIVGGNRRKAQEPGVGTFILRRKNLSHARMKPEGIRSLR